ncbi:hypothetical protein NX862_04835 [Rhodobacter sp. KR11]|uniref:hypothetical protein n=1 Tax=Rhodobacter sp. KR11 TaxID=2974588 RepID=UPI002221D524|nr:hypothetical protein [Rhodobacter sp. KR11]MCW1918071.1 hypothetical protein [Rhodobacter sp. KR11]
MVWLALIVTVRLGGGRLDQDAAAGKLMTASSPICAMVSSVTSLRRKTAGAASD